MANSFSDYGYNRDAGPTKIQLMASSGIALTDSNIGQNNIFKPET